MNEESKYTISELKQMLKEFYQYHPDQHCDEWYAPINAMETDGAACFLNWMETGEYGKTEWEDE